MTHPQVSAGAGQDADPDEPDLARLDALPSHVRTRVVALAAEVLTQVPGLPPSLRRVADFAPARRARAGGAAILTALADDDLRARIATQVAARTGRDDEVEVAARAWLTREANWQDAIERAVTQAADAVDVERVVAELDRTRSRAEAAEQALREARAKAKSQVEDYKAENSTLRRKLGEARAAERQAREAARRAEAAAEEAGRRAEAAQSGQDKELRRLRARVEELEAAEGARRRTTRADRDEASLRARLLLDAVIDAATGLRRELALPVVPGNPADRVEAAFTEAVDDARGAGAGGLGPASAALLEQSLGLPRARLIVDGYNVSKSAWERQSLEAQRQRLLRGLAPLVARTGAETTVVFDAANVTSRPVVAAPRGIKVVFSPTGVIADVVIADLVAAEPPGRVVIVVSDDQEVARDARAAGARSIASSALVDLLGRV